MRRVQIAFLGVCLSLAAACGGAGAAGAGGASEPSGGEGGGSTVSSSGGESSAGAATGSGDDVAVLLVDVIAPRLCESLRGSFVGLPGDGGTTGPASGSDPTVGRWWIRECSASVDGDRLSLSIAGTGWTWVDRESMGFRVRQYLRFDATAAFRATMEVAYDRPHRIATIWMRPDADVTAAVTPRGLVQAEATNVMSGMLGGLLELTGSSASARAQQQVADEGSQRLRERFGSGFTVTFAMDNEQMDFMVGALARGQVPVRPYEAEAGVTWSVNQRMQLWPSGLDVIGPVLDGRGPQALDLELEEGEGLIVEAICAPEFERFYDQMLQGAQPTPPRGTRVMEFAHAGSAQRAVVPALGCPTLLLVTTRDGATLPARMRVRVTPADAPTATARAQQAATGPTVATGTTTPTTTTATAHPVRIQMTALTVSPQSATGSRWDMIGGEPDPYVIVVSIPGQREVQRTEAASDRHEVPLDAWLPGAFRPEDLPLRFSVYDDDVGSDELIGVVDLAPGQIPASGGEISLELRSQDTVPRTMGTLRVRVQPVQ
ncbi:C2 domain-containing protein [Sandaracinus amylolyticus]|uniref:C2 domain-containing protein n=1 Tax=Sandaracinus amylolyticus TaxID=927083 RepID=UPI00069FE7D2|nr:C2 domain-containing protein [Sandaracinus amylolyticus]